MGSFGSDRIGRARVNTVGLSNHFGRDFKPDSLLRIVDSGMELRQVIRSGLLYCLDMRIRWFIMSET